MLEDSQERFRNLFGTFRDHVGYVSKMFMKTLETFPNVTFLTNIPNYISHVRQLKLDGRLGEGGLTLPQGKRESLPGPKRKRENPGLKLEAHFRLTNSCAHARHDTNRFPGWAAALFPLTSDPPKLGLFPVN